MEAIRMENLVKTYGSGSTAVHALKNVSLYVNSGEVVGIFVADIDTSKCFARPLV